MYAPPCVPVFTGANGGATSGGVTGTTINLVYYQPQPGGLASTILDGVYYGQIAASQMSESVMPGASTCSLVTGE